MTDKSKKPVPKFDYENVLQALRAQLAVVPPDIYDWAYAFRDFLEEHYGTQPSGDYKQSISTGRHFPLSEKWTAQSLYVTYTVEVEVETHSVYHDDTETTRTISLTVKRPMFDDFRTVLPWKRENKQSEQKWVQSDDSTGEGK